MRHLNVRIKEHIRISPLTKKKVNPKCSAVSNHLLLCNHSCANQEKQKICIRIERMSPNKDR